jgi:hypothetical protein
MSESLETIKQLIDECTAEERKVLSSYIRSSLRHPLELEWGIDADTILTAIRRSSDLTKRGVRGIIAEAVFVVDVLPTLVTSGWQGAEIAADLSYDAIVKNGSLSARIQVKLQRSEKGVPKLYYPNHYEKDSLFVVEVQKTRSGEKTATMQGGRDDTAAATPHTIKTRPYRFGDFDILAVSMHPSSGDWRSFRYTLGEWLLPRVSDRTLIEIFQPVAAIPNDVWTDDLATCLEWFRTGVKRQILGQLLHRPKRK